MTIDELIAELQKARETLPSGGGAGVQMPDGLLVLRAIADAGCDAVFVTDMDEEGRTSRDRDFGADGDGDARPQAIGVSVIG